MGVASSCFWKSERKGDELCGIHGKVPLIKPSWRKQIGEGIQTIEDIGLPEEKRTEYCLMRL